MVRGVRCTTDGVPVKQNNFAWFGIIASAYTPGWEHLLPVTDSAHLDALLLIGFSCLEV